MTNGVPFLAVNQWPQVERTKADAAMAEYALRCGERDTLAESQLRDGLLYMFRVSPVPMAYHHCFCRRPRSFPDYFTSYYFPSSLLQVPFFCPSLSCSHPPRVNECRLVTFGAWGDM